MKKYLILDRDGVINYDSDAYIKSPEEWLPIPGSLEAIAQLNQQGFTVAVATNQSGLARGYFDEATLAQIHQKMHDSLAQVGGKIDQIFYCPHGPQDNCVCRKPLPGLLHQIAQHYQIRLTGVPMVGDSFRDIEAAQSAGASAVLVLSGKGQKTQDKYATQLAGIPVYDNLYAFVQQFLS